MFEQLDAKESTSSGSALYYPFFEMKENWFKAAILYWDQIARIIPPSYVKHAPQSDLIGCAEAEGLIYNCDPLTYVSRASECFRETVLPRLLGETPSDQVIWRLIAANPRDFLPLHDEKIDHTLREMLQDVGWLYDDPNSHEAGFLRLNPQVAGVYMVCLGSVMSTHGRMPLVTDTSEYAPAGEFMQFCAGAPLHATPDRLATLINLGVDFPTAADLVDVPLKSLIQFHKKRAPERRRFRAAIELIVTGVASLTDTNARADYLRDKETEIRHAITDHQKVLDELRVRSIHSALKLTCPALLSSAAVKTIGTQFAAAAPAIAALGLAIAGVAWWADHRSHKLKAVKECPWHYLLEL